MLVTTARVGSAIELRDVGIEWSLGCEDGRPGGLLTTGETLSPGYMLPPARLDFDEVLMWQAMHFHGRLGAHIGSGTSSGTLPALTADEQAQLCTSGDAAWRVWRIDAGKRPIVP
jgi:hypothetical protein